MLFLTEITKDNQHELFIERDDGEYIIPCITSKTIDIKRFVNSLKMLRSLNKQMTRMLILNDENQIIYDNIIFIEAAARYFSIRFLYNSYLN